MTLTTERVIFSRSSSVESLWRPPAVLRLMAAAALTIVIPNLRRPVQVRLRDITRLWKWHPEFSGRPMLQVGSDAWYVQLIEFGHTRKRADISAMREHFEVLESAWAAAHKRSTPP